MPQIVAFFAMPGIAAASALCIGERRPAIVPVTHQKRPRDKEQGGEHKDRDEYRLILNKGTQLVYGQEKPGDVAGFVEYLPCQWECHNGSHFKDNEKTRNDDVSQKLVWEKWLEHLRAFAFCIVFHPKILPAILTEARKSRSSSP